jgi:DNA-binding protein H-NS
MTTTRIELASKIVELERQLEEARKEADKLLAQERAAVVTQLNEHIAEHRIASHELTFPRPYKGKKSPATKSTKTQTGTTNPPKYCNPQTGQTWSGRGQPPGWIKDALDRNAFLIND